MSYKNPKRIIKSYLKNRLQYFYFEIDNVLYKVHLDNFSFLDKVNRLFFGDIVFIRVSLLNLEGRLQSFHLLSEYIQVEPEWKLFYNKHIDSEEYDLEKNIEDVLVNKKIEILIDYSKYPPNGICNTSILIKDSKISFIISEGLRLNNYDLELIYLIMYKRLIEVSPDTENLEIKMSLNLLDISELSEEVRRFVVSYFKTRNILTKFKSVNNEHLGFVSSVVQIPKSILKEIFKEIV